MPAKKRKRKNTLNPIIILGFLIIGLLLVTVAIFSKSTSLSNNLKTQVSSPSPLMVLCDPSLAQGTVTPTAVPGLAEKTVSLSVNPPNSTNLTRTGILVLLRFAGAAYDEAKTKAIDKLYQDIAPPLAPAELKCDDNDCTVDDNATVTCKKPSDEKITLSPTRTEYLDSIRQLLAAGGTNTQLITWEDYTSGGTKRNARISAYVTATGPVLCETTCIGKYPFETTTPDVTQCGGVENEPACAPAAKMVQTVVVESDYGEDITQAALTTKLETQAKERLNTLIGSGCTSWLNHFATKFDPPSGCNAANPASSTRTDHDTCDNNIRFISEENIFYGKVWCRATCNATQSCSIDPTDSPTPTPDSTPSEPTDSPSP